MESIVKQTREVGTSAGVLLPRKWLNKQVVVTLFLPSTEEIIKNIIEILIKYNLNEEIKGIYLYGSYARRDYDFDSDIDVLVITHNTNKIITSGNYELLLVAEKNFVKDLSSSLAYYSIVNEIKILINKDLIEKISSKKYKLKTSKILKEIDSIVKVNKDTIEMCKKNNKKIPDGVAYSIVLRLRELYLIKCLILNKKYSKADFLKICPEKIYLAYIRTKRNEKEIDDVSPEEIKKLIDLSEKWLEELKG